VLRDAMAGVPGPRPRPAGQRGHDQAQGVAAPHAPQAGTPTGVPACGVSRGGGAPRSTGPAAGQGVRARCGRTPLRRAASPAHRSAAAGEPLHCDGGGAERPGPGTGARPDHRAGVGAARRAGADPALVARAVRHRRPPPDGRRSPPLRAGAGRGAARSGHRRGARHRAAQRRAGAARAAARSPSCRRRWSACWTGPSPATSRGSPPCSTSRNGPSGWRARSTGCSCRRCRRSDAAGSSVSSTPGWSTWPPPPRGRGSPGAPARRRSGVWLRCCSPRLPATGTPWRWRPSTCCWTGAAGRPASWAPTPRWTPW
jgi:hypothetical protein